MKKLALLLLCALFTPLTAYADEKPPACTEQGVNLLHDLDRSDPALWKAVREQAEKVPNHKGLIWKIEKDGAKPSFLFGTMHVSDPRVLKLPEAAEAAYRTAGTVVIETTDMLDPKSFLRIRLEQPGLMLFTDSSTLKSHLPAGRRADLEDKLGQRGIVLDAVAKLKPWVVTTLLILPQCERERMNRGEKPLDVVLALDAQAEGRPVTGLETAAEQFQAMDRLPLDFQIRNLVAMIDYGDRIADAIETTTALYLQGETGMIVPALRKLIPDELSDEDYALFRKALVTDRNHVMAERAVPLLEKGDAFIAVGALHLPGAEGLVELLRARGYRLTAL